jgi:hypothetical protein
VAAYSDVRVQDRAEVVVDEVVESGARAHTCAPR